MAFLPVEKQDQSELVQQHSQKTESYALLEQVLVDSQAPLPDRFRALFTLKSLNTPEAVDCIAKGNFVSSFIILIY